MLRTMVFSNLKKSKANINHYVQTCLYNKSLIFLVVFILIIGFGFFIWLNVNDYKIVKIEEGFILHPIKTGG